MNKVQKFQSIAFLIIFCNLGLGNIKAQNKKDSHFKKIYSFALRGELTKVFNILDTINNLNENQKFIKKRYHDRFITQNESYDFNTKKPDVIEFVKLYQSYWKSTMLNKTSLEQADYSFRNSMTNLLAPHFKSKGIQIEVLNSNLYKYSNEFLKDKGYYSNAYGKTGHLYDLFLWKTDEVKVYPIGLVDDSVEVTVHFMKDFISTGWSHYATFGRNYASGWATKEALFSVDSAYDRNSENFRVSYLAHEGQHFLDYKIFPQLKQTDLEYRSKLVELIKSRETTFRIISKFIANGYNNKNNAHGYANYCVIRDLSKLIFNMDYLTDNNEWNKVSKEIIKKKSLELYKIHTSQLHKIGAKTVTRYINL